MKIPVIFICILVTLCTSNAKTFDKCQFVTQLAKHGVPDWQIPTFSCLAHWESGYDSSKLNYKTGAHGIFQINEHYWCSPYKYPGRKCETTCNYFRDDHLGDDIACAMKIYQDTLAITRVGYDAWKSYWEHCDGNNVEYIEGCYVDLL